MCVATKECYITAVGLALPQQVPTWGVHAAASRREGAKPDDAEFERRAGNPQIAYRSPLLQTDRRDAPRELEGDGGAIAPDATCSPPAKGLRGTFWRCIKLQVIAGGVMCRWLHGVSCTGAAGGRLARHIIPLRPFSSSERGSLEAVKEG